MNVGETKTLTLPPSISNLTLKDVVFTSGDPINVKILYNTATTVTIEAVAATNSYIPIMCDFYYYTLRSGKWIYAHHEPFYFMVAVFGSGQNPDPTPNPDSWDGNGTCTITTAEGIPMKFIIINETNKYCAPWGNALNGGTCIDKSTAGKVTIPERIGNYRVYNTGSSAFQNCKNLTTIILPTSVVTTGQRSFKNCESLSSGGSPGKVGESAVLRGSMAVPPQFIAAAKNIRSGRYE